MPTVMLVCELAFGARVLLQSDVLPFLKKGGARVVVLTPDPDVVRDELASRGHGDVVVEGFDPDAFTRPGHPLRVQVARKARLLAVQSRTADDTFRMEIRDAQRARRWRAAAVAWAARGLAEGMRRSAAVAREAVAAENKWATTTVLRDVFARHQPELVVTTSTGTFGSDRFVIREAKQAGIKVACYVLSWDNTTVRGLGVGLEDHVIAWSEVMLEELVRLHRVPAHRVSVGGVPHFDAYARGAVASRAELADRLGLDPARPFVLVGTKSPNTFRCNADVARLVLEASAAGRLPRDLQVVARLHPIYHRRGEADGKVPPRLAEEEAEWAALKAEFPNDLVLDVPQVTPSKLDFFMPTSEIDKLGGLLREAAVVVNMFSTLNIEAAIFDTPTVNVGFDFAHKRPVAGKVERFDIRYDEVQDHNQRLIKTGGTRVVHDPDALVAAVSAYFDDPKLDADGRKRIVANECGSLLGASSDAVATRLLRLATETEA